MSEEQAIKQDILEIKSDIRDLYNRSNMSNDRQTKIETTLEYIKNSIDELKAQVKQLTETPARRWDVIVNTGISAIVGGLAAIGLTKFIK